MRIKSRALSELGKRLEDVLQSQYCGCKFAVPVRTGIFSIRLESNKTVYRLGEPIELRVTLINYTVGYYAAFWAPTYGLCRVVVVNQQGRRLHSTGEWGGMYEFPPNNAVAATFSDPQSRWSLREWADIKYWGYNLNQTGDYYDSRISDSRCFR